ncbi:MAG TPA: hypothetical protein VFC00_27450 [Micromonosporaceae bacterium]|nr:hypothetical protein [Micromonosporaceae bacterium]
MTAYQFTVIVASVPTAAQVHALMALDDGPRVVRNEREGIGRVRFRRSRPDLADAVVSAVRDVEAMGLRPVRLVDQDWVNLADIAERIGRSREAVRLWSIGRVGPGGFPPPLNPGRETLFYSWADVAPWLRERMGLDVPEPEWVLVAANLGLRLRALAPRVPRMDLVRGLLP